MLARGGRRGLFWKGASTWRSQKTRPLPPTLSPLAAAAA